MRPLRRHLRPALSILTALALVGCGARSALDVPGAGPAGSGAGPAGSATHVVAIALGWDSSCALLSDETAACWGLDASGQLGDAPTPASRLAPAPLANPTGIVSLSGGYSHACAVLRDGSLQCWGDGNLGEVGDGAQATFTPPTRVAVRAVSVSAGFLYTCGVIDGSVVACWGVGDHGQLGGMAYSGYYHTTPTAVAGASPAVAVAVHDYTSCALDAGGAIQCWGLGPLGDGMPGDSPTPVDVQGLSSPAKEVVVGSNHVCALLEDATVTCWGYGGYGELGLGPTVAMALAPTPVPGASPAKALSAGENHTCAVLEDGTAKCWGDISAGGKGTFTPVQVPGLSGAVAIASGQSHDCALLGAGGVVCWGDNSSGQLGDGTTNPSPTPVAVVGLP